MAGLVITDGGRHRAGFATATDAGDCFVRAVAVATSRPYRMVYDEVADWSATQLGGRRTARDGVTKKLSRSYLADQGWEWHPTMHIGQGCQVHLRADELPGGVLICQLSKHVVAVIDGVVHDNHDPRRDGTRCVYGYWTAP